MGEFFKGDTYTRTYPVCKHRLPSENDMILGDPQRMAWGNLLQITRSITSSTFFYSQANQMNSSRCAMVCRYSGNTDALPGYLVCFTRIGNMVWLRWSFAGMSWHPSGWGVYLPEIRGISFSIVPKRYNGLKKTEWNKLQNWRVDIPIELWNSSGTKKFYRSEYQTYVLISYRETC